MIGSDAIESVLGSRPEGQNADLGPYVRAAVRAGLAVVPVSPTDKMPLDMRTAVQKRADDADAQEAAKGRGVVAYQKARSKSGVHVATTDTDRAVKYFARAEKQHGVVNFGIEVGRSGLVVVDADNAADREKFEAEYLERTGHAISATVLSPGKFDEATNEWVHRDGGHYYFTVPAGMDRPDSGSVSRDGWTAYWVNRLVLAPPSKRAEGPYRWQGAVRPLPEFLRADIEAWGQVRAERLARERVAGPIDDWSAATPWDALLEPDGWTATGHTDSCGCPTWTAPGPHDNPKSAVAHEDGCTHEAYFSPNLHLWTDNPPDGLADYVRQFRTQTLSKIQYEAWTKFAGRIGDACASWGIAQLPPEHAAEDFAIGDAPAPAESTWKRIDLGAIARGNNEAQQPTIFPRSDGRFLLYPGLTHSFHGESESGKSLVLQWVCVLEMGSGHHVLYLDYESDPVSVTRRLVDMGATVEQIETYFDYRLPEAAPDSTPGDRAAFLGLLTPGKYSLAVIDGVTASIGTFGASSQSNDDVNLWTRKLPRALATRTGAAVAMVDHVTKDKDSRGRYAIGAQAKMADITGAAYMVEPDRDAPVGKGTVGKIRLRIGKDRPSEVRRHCTDYRAGDHSHLVGDVIVDSTGDTLSLSLVSGAGKQVDASVATARRPKLMESISRSIESAMDDGETEWSAAAVERRVTGQGARIRANVKALVTEGYLANDPINNRLTFVRPYREADDMEVRSALPAGDPYADDAQAAK
ncbi:bifunctional DNA primase/polymerase [Rhodococcus sp. 14-2470-1a]|uniref:bifunctional DNA primase/polymerase n=1 Tax=Rhodococcus sp. 14-2470-1a TaxID=2023150 RepID=UPI000B9B39C4|nr:bifunctional DNA primase/polymerase [Rhodococcus sp. 14-2470-1a]OZF44279.1 hypothetical protein CH292_24595 [Rhodococcus sp. 14-2470-1a]